MKALVGADGIPGQRHPLQDGMRVAFQQIAVHEGAGVALIRVADEILLPPGDGARIAPLPPVG